MDKVLSTFNSNKTIAAFVSAVLIVLAGEMALNTWGIESTMVKYFKYLQKISTIEKIRDILIFGDSVSKGAIRYDDLNDSLRMNITNLSMDGSGPIISYLLLKKVVNNNIKPKSVIWAHSPHTYTGVRYNVLVGGFCTWEQITYLVMHGYSPRKIIAAIPSKLSYLNRYSTQFKNALLGDVSFFVEKNDINSLHKDSEKNESNIFDSTFQLPTELPSMYLNKFIINPNNQKCMDNVFKLLQKHGVPVYWLTMPVTERVYAVRQENTFNQEYYRQLDDWKTKYGLQFLQKDFLVFKSAYFGDYSHLNVFGARKFSQYFDSILLVKN